MYNLLAELERSRETLTNDPQSYRQFCESVIVPDGDMKGQPLNPDIHPAQREIVRALDSGYRKIVIAKPVQDGGSLILTMPLLKRAVKQGQTVLLAYPTLDAAKDVWTMKVWPILQAFGGQEPKSGGGSRGGAARVVSLPGGGRFVLRQAGGRKESAQASVTGDAIEVDEVDDWPDSHRVELIGARISRAADPLQVYVSTVKRDTGSLILSMWNEQTATQSHLEYPCPYCATYQRLAWDQVDLEHGSYTCAECESSWLEPERLKILEHAKRVDANPGAPAFSLIWTALESPFPVLVEGRRMPVLPGLVAMFRRAQAAAQSGDHGPMRSFNRDRLTRTYQEPTDEEGATLIPTRNRLAALSTVSVITLDVDRKEQGWDSVHLCHVPEWVEHIAVAGDVQQGGDRAPGRIYFVVIGRGGGRGCIIGWGTIICAEAGRVPSVQELHSALDRLDSLMKGWQPGAPIVRKCLDVGDRQDEIRAWLKIHPDWWAIKGTGPIKPQVMDHAGWIYQRRQDTGWTLWLIETQSVTRITQGEILASGNESTGLDLPHGLTRESALVKHICATVEYLPGKWSLRATDRKHHPEWQTRHDYLDAAVYARALIYHYEQRPPPSADVDTVASLPMPAQGGWMAGYQ